MAQTHKTCVKCGLEKSLDEFNMIRKWKNRICRACRATRSRKWRLANPEMSRINHVNSHFKRRYGLVLADIEAMRKAQNCRCKVCGRHESTLKRVLQVDHNHETGRVRALLCGDCNAAEGRLRNAAKARALANYMDEQDTLDKLVTVL